MSQDTNVSNLIINKLTQTQYEGITTPDPTQLYMITDTHAMYLGSTLIVSSNLPSQTGQSGKFLTTDGTSASWATVPTEVLLATYGTTTFAEITTAANNNKIVVCEYYGTIYYLEILGDADNDFPHVLSAAVDGGFYSLEVLPNNSWSQKSRVIKIGGNYLALGDNNVQPSLVSGTNIKTINNTSILGSGNISITAPSPTYDSTNERITWA